MSSRVVILILALAVGLLAGCGGDDGDDVAGVTTVDEEAVREQFEQRVAESRDDVESALRNIGDARSQSELSDRLDEAAEELRISATELRETEVPPDAQAETDQLVAGMERLAGEFDAASENVAGGDLEDLLRQARSFDFTAVGDINDALEELERQGYDVGRVSDS